MKAAIDVGSNTVRLLLGEVMDGRVVPSLYQRRITRLGGGYVPEYGIAQDAAERTLQALEEFAEIIASKSPEQIRAVGTEAIRRACNSSEFVKAVVERTGIRLEILAGEEEARLSACGVLNALEPIPSFCLVIDIGGGSTEFIFLQNGHAIFHTSYRLGVVTLAESNNPSASIRRQIGLLVDDLDKAGILDQACAPACELVGTAGTITTIAAIDMGMAVYDWRRVNNYILHQGHIEATQRQFIVMTPHEREAVSGMEKGRGDLIVHGIEIVLELMKVFNKKTLKVSDFGLLEGVLLSIR